MLNYKYKTRVGMTKELTWSGSYSVEGFLNCYGTSINAYFEGEDGAADIYVRYGDATVRGGCSLVPKGTFTCIADASSYIFIFGLHGFQTSSYYITDSGTYNNHCYVIGSAISGYQMNGAYNQY